MKGLNLILAGLAISVLIVTLCLLGWLRQRAQADVERSVTSAVQSFDRGELLHGLGGDAMVYFDRAEREAERAKRSPYINEVVVTKLTAGGEEIPIVPFTLYAEKGQAWREGLRHWRREPLGGAKPFGYLYLNQDLSALRSLKWAIATLGLATALMLVTLLARVWSQETSLTRTMIELNERRGELIRIERLALAGQLSASLLHDLRKPVLHIKNSLEDLTEALGDFAPASVALQDLHLQTRLFFQMLSESQIERFVQSDRAGEEYVDTSQIIDLALGLVRYERRGVEVTHRVADTLPMVLAPPFRLIQLYSNLILNAYQALKGRGHLILEAQAEGAGVEVRVIDNGPGIPPAVIDHVFDPFFTTKPEGEGTGLGLSICRMIADELHGRIGVESAQGGSTVFRVWLPAASDAEPEASVRD